MHTKITIAIGALVITASVALGTETSVPHIKADQVHALGIDGFGVTVAVIDRGLDSSHPALPGISTPAGGAISVESCKPIPAMTCSILGTGRTCH